MAAGPLTGTSVPTAARYMVMTKGPLTGAVTCSNSGGHFPKELKPELLDGLSSLGIDQLLITSQGPYRIEEIFVQTTYDFESVGNEYKRGSQIGGSFSYRSYDRLMQMPLYSTYDNNDAVAKVNEFLQRL